MDGNAWLWVAIVAFLVFCCLPMLFMRHGAHGSRQDDRHDGVGPSGGGDEHVRK